MALSEGEMATVNPTVLFAVVSRAFKREIKIVPAIFTTKIWGDTKAGNVVIHEDDSVVLVDFSVEINKAIERTVDFFKAKYILSLTFNFRERH